MITNYYNFILESKEFDFIGKDFLLLDDTNNDNIITIEDQEYFILQDITGRLEEFPPIPSKEKNLYVCINKTPTQFNSTTRFGNINIISKRQNFIGQELISKTFDKYNYWDSLGWLIYHQKRGGNLGLKAYEKNIEELKNLEFEFYSKYPQFLDSKSILKKTTYQYIGDSHEKLINLDIIFKSFYTKLKENYDFFNKISKIIIKDDLKNKTKLFYIDKDLDKISEFTNIDISSYRKGDVFLHYGYSINKAYYLNFIPKIVVRNKKRSVTYYLNFDGNWYEEHTTWFISIPNKSYLVSKGFFGDDKMQKKIFTQEVRDHFKDNGINITGTIENPSKFILNMKDFLKLKLSRNE